MSYIQSINPTALAAISPTESIASKPISYGLSTDSSIGKSVSKPSPRTLFSPPKLLEAMEETDRLARMSMQIASFEITSSSDKIRDHMEEKALTLKKAAERAAEQQVWSVLQMIGACFLSTYNIALGYNAVATAPVLGTFMIAAGMLSAANIAMEKVDGWNLVAEKLAQDNEEFRKQLLFFGPLSINAISLALGTVGSQATALSLPLKDSLEKSMQLYTSTSMAGQSVTDARISLIQSDLSEITGKIALENFIKESILSWITDLHSQVNQGWEEAKNVLQTYTQMRIQL